MIQSGETAGGSRTDEAEGEVAFNRVASDAITSGAQLGGGLCRLVSEPVRATKARGWDALVGGRKREIQTDPWKVVCNA